MMKFLVALMTLGIFGLTTLAISSAAHAQTDTPKKKKSSKKKSKKSAKKKKKKSKAPTAASNSRKIQSPSVNLPVHSQTIEPSPAADMNRASALGTPGIDPLLTNPTTPETPMPQSKPVHRL